MSPTQGDDDRSERSPVILVPRWTEGLPWPVENLLGPIIEQRCRLGFNR